MIHLIFPKNRFLLNVLFLILFILFNSNSVLKSSNLFNKYTLTDSILSKSDKRIGSQVYTVIEQMPQFPGGQKSMNDFINQNIHYPEEAYKNKTEGKVVVQFIVSETGKIRNATVVKKASPDLDQEALRLINSFPSWEPGIQNGKPVPVYFTLPITFKYTHISNIKNSNIRNDSTNWKITDSTQVIINNLKLPLGFNLDVINTEEIDTGFALKPFTEEKKIKLINQYGPLAKNGVLLLETYELNKSINTTTSNKQGDDISNHISVDKMPQYPGGEIAFMRYITKKMKYPKMTSDVEIPDKIFINFVIDRTGKVKSPRILNNFDPHWYSETQNLLKSMPDWIPGESQGKKVNVHISLPIRISIDGKENKQSSKVDVGKEKKLLLILDGDTLPRGFDLYWLNFEKIIDYKVLIPTNEKEKKQYIEKYGLDGMNGIVEIKSAKSIKKTDYPDKPKDSLGNRIYEVIEVMPKFPGGEEKLLKFINKNLKYPEISKANHIQGRVILRFVVNSRGNVEKAEVIRSLDPECDKEVLRVINLLPTWIPGRQNGVNVSVWYTLPVNFSL